MNSAAPHIGRAWRQWLPAACLWIAVADLLLHEYCSVTRLHLFRDPDTMNFVDIAHNVLSGRGLSQSTLGFNEPHISADDPIPAAFGSQAPLFPVLIAALAWLGPSCADSALLLAGLGTGAILALVYALAARYYDRAVAAYSVALLMAYEPLRKVATTPFSETVGVAFLLLALLLLSRAAETTRLDRHWAAAAGLAAGLAIATRYALNPVLPLGFLFLLFEVRHKLHSVMLFGAAAALPIGTVLVRSLLVSGSILPSPNPSAFGLFQLVAQAFWMSATGYFDFRGRLPQYAEVGLLLASVLSIAAVLAARRQLPSALRETWLSERRYLLPTWAALYSLVLLIQRARFHFDWDARLLLPASIVVILMFVAMAQRVLGSRREWILSTSVLVLMSVVGLREVRLLAAAPAYIEGRDVLRSEKLKWLASHTTKHDLVIGNDTVAVPFLLEHDAAVSFSPYPYTDYATYDLVLGYARKHASLYEHFYLVWDAYTEREDAWRADYGPFVTDIVFDRMKQYPALHRVPAPPGVLAFALEP